jgi:hypothetical protein
VSRTLRFHKDVYVGEAVDEAVKTFDRFATFTLSDEGAHWVVALEAKRPELELRIAGELSNFALGLTVKHRGRT